MTARSTRWRWIAGVTTMLIVLGGLMGAWLLRRAGPLARRLGGTPAATYVGRAACALCHAVETKLYAGSRHDLAMQPADSSTVLGNFSGTSFRHFDVTSRFYRRDGGYFVTTDGPDGKLAEFKVAYTFGVFPLQQYLVPMSGGRYQALSVAWDSRPKSEGGQRWFHLYPKERIPAGDILHWTGPEQNWNYMCAECHSTNLKKGWRSDSTGYVTTWSEIDVSCEACHGPGSAHVAWARKHHAAGSPAAMGLLVDLREPAYAWAMDGTSGIARRSRPRQSAAELETCARCHARRTSLSEDYLPGRPLLQTHKPALLDERLYYADGQQLEEVYEYGSFLQSRMHAAGVSCGDCHDPHSLHIRTEPDALCERCHLPASFATTAHHHHRPGSKGASCVACHMPTRDYMVVDARRDHSFRVPRPDLSAKIGSPNACNGCHTERPTAWAEHAMETWYPHGRWTQPHYGEALDAGRRGLPGAEVQLTRLIDDAGKPGIVRATATELLADYLSPASLPTLERALKDLDGMVRSAALDAVAALPPAERVRLAQPLLRDTLRGVRIEAASALAAESNQLTPVERPAFDEAAAEYRAAEMSNADRPESHSNLGALDARLGDRGAARREYETGLRIGPWFTGLWVNLADLLREDGDDAEGERVLRRGLAVAVDKAELHHALGLNLARQKRSDEALREFKQSVELVPGNTRYAYVYGVALLSSGKPDPALAVFESALAKRPADRELLVALATTNRDLGRLERARTYARRLVETAPGDPQARQLLEELDGAMSRGRSK
jgi:Flp pilus assembly protein TadD/cytochrome c553